MKNENSWYQFLAKKYYQYFDVRLRDYQHWYHFFPAGAKILDLACGIGDFAVNGKNVTGIDHNRASLKIAKQRGCRVVYGDVLKLPFSPKSFDGVFCAHLIEHLDPPLARKLLQEINKVLKVGGCLVLQTPLLHAGFYNDFTHEKVYAPEAIMHYLTNTTQTNHAAIGNYRVLQVKYRYAEFFTPLLEPVRLPSSGWKNFQIGLKVISLLLYSIGIKNYFIKNGYTLVLQKLQ